LGRPSKERSAEKAKQSGGFLGFQVEPYSGNAIYRCSVDAQGRFVLTGVAPNAVLRGALFNRRIQAGNAGSAVEVQLE
jgi:hypothetical protein